MINKMTMTVKTKKRTTVAIEVLSFLYTIGLIRVADCLTEKLLKDVEKNVKRYVDIK